MGYVEMYKDGKVTRFEGGEIVKVSKSFICDNCETEQPVDGSEIVSAQGLGLIQFCYTCKTMNRADKFRRVAEIKDKRE